MPRKQIKRAARPMAVAGPEHVGRFAYSEYWRKWDEILACGVGDDGRSWWHVRGVGETHVRAHCTVIPADCICDAPRLDGQQHLPPVRPTAQQVAA